MLEDCRSVPSEETRPVVGGVELPTLPERAGLGRDVAAAVVDRVANEGREELTYSARVPCAPRRRG